METINGEVKKGEKKFALINTADYNMDGKYQVFVFGLEEAESLGLDNEEVKDLDGICVGERMTFQYGVDAQVIRLG